MCQVNSKCIDGFINRIQRDFRDQSLKPWEFRPSHEFPNYEDSLWSS